MPTRPTIRRSCAGRNLAPRKGGVQREFPPLSGAASRSGGCAPSYQESSRGGWAGKLGRLCRRAGGPNQRRNAGPSLPLAAAAARCGCRACPARLQLVSLCRFLPIFHPGRRPPFGPRPRRYDLFLFVDFSDAPQRGRPTTVRPVPGRYDLSPFVDLSSAAQTQAAPRPSRHGGAGKNACHYSIQIKPLRPTEVCEANEPGSGS